GANAWIQNVTWRATNDVWWWSEENDTAHQKLLHWDGTSITATPVAYTGAAGPGITAATAVGDTWWVVGFDGTVYQTVAGAPLAPVIAPKQLGSTLWGTSDNDMYFGVYHWDGATLAHVDHAVVTGLGAERYAFANTQHDAMTGAYVRYMEHYDG